MMDTLPRTYDAMDATIRCPVEGCAWHVPLWAGTCTDHGGPPALQWCDNEWGDTVYRGETHDWKDPE